MLVLLLAQLFLCVTRIFAVPVNPRGKFEGRSTSGRYIIKLKDGVDRVAHVQSLTLDSSSSIEYEYDVINGYVGTFADTELSYLNNHTDVEYVEIDAIATISGTRSSVPWGLNRISTGPTLTNRDGTKLTFTYTFANLGASVDIYMVDTGILVSHSAFEGRAIWGATFGGYINTDENGHGTHTAGIAISNPYGVAQSARAIAVRVLDASGSGAVSDIVAGLQWVGNNAKSTGRRSVISMSLGLSSSQALDDAVRSLIFSGIAVVVSAGNTAQDASFFSPSRVKEAIVVGASDITDTMAYFSNFGSTVTLFAPGVDVISTYYNGGTTMMSGTSMATPYAAGQVAVFFSSSSTATPADAAAYLRRMARSNVLSGIPSGTANLLLNNGFTA